MSKILISISFVVLALAGVLLLFNNSSTPAKSNQKILIHLVTNIKKEDGPPCVVFDVALANLKLYGGVELLFDAEAAWNLKVDSTDGKNDFDRYEVPMDLKNLVNEQFHDSSILALENFGEFLEFLHKNGAEISVNGTWNVLTGVEKSLMEKSHLPAFVEPLDLKELAEHINGSDVYYHY